MSKSNTKIKSDVLKVLNRSQGFVPVHFYKIFKEALCKRLSLASGTLLNNCLH